MLFYLQNSELCSIGVHKPCAQGRRGNLISNGYA